MADKYTPATTMRLARMLRTFERSPQPLAQFQGVQVIGSRPFLGVIVDKGPNGQEDFEDERYWVKMAHVSNTGAPGDPLKAIATRVYKKEETRFAIRMATNLAEVLAGSHSLALDTPVTIRNFPDRSEPRIRRWWMNVGGGGGIAVQQFKVKLQYDDYLFCHTWDAWKNKEGKGYEWIAKPYLLRRTPFDFNLNGKKRRRGIKYIYDDEGEVHWERTAIIGDEGEEQIIVPAYVSEEGRDIIGDDLIIAAVDVIGGTGIEIGEDPDKFKIMLLDDNSGGRTWARKRIQEQ